MRATLLRQRHRQAEIMDDPNLNAAEHRRALRALARVNRLSMSARLLWPSIRDLCREHGRIRVLDVATGGGDVPAQLWKLAQSAGLPIEFAGCDLSPVAIEHARQHVARRKADMALFALDVLNAPLPSDYDVITCSLFLHHLDEDQALAVLRKMRAAARHLALVNDLARGPLGWLAAYVGTRVLTRSRTVHIDGPISVEGAFTPDEALTLAHQAGWDEATVVRRFPFRYLLSWKRRG